MRAVNRDDVITDLAEALRERPKVHAVWLEGSDALGTVDSHSDIDIVVDVEDGEEEAILAVARDRLREFGPLDYVSTITQPAEGLRRQVIHIADTPATLLIDIVVQSHSRDFTFLRGHPSEIPKVLFDRSNVIRFRDVDARELERHRIERTATLAAEFRPGARIPKYLERGQFLEALAVYRKFLLEPLVEILRLRYCPLVSEYGLVQVSRHLPADVVARLERLHAVTSTADIAQCLIAGEAWFRETVTEMAVK